MTNNKSMDGELQWKNWAKYLNDTADIIEEIRKISEVSFFDSQQLNTFFAKLNSFMSSRRPYIETYEHNKNKLKQIGSLLFSKRYLYDLNKNNKSPKLLKAQYKAMMDLNDIFSNIINDLSKYEILPKVKKIDRSIPSIIRKQNEDL